jgi:hypothetical protein
MALGLYIDRMPDAAADRVLTAQDWTVGAMIGQTGARCLVGHAEDWCAYHGPRDDEAYGFTIGFEIARVGRYGDTADCVGFHFDRLARRVGLERAVSLVKSRAGKRTRVEIPECETVGTA